jgi:hypothetical protein
MDTNGRVVEFSSFVSLRVHWWFGKFIRHHPCGFSVDVWDAIVMNYAHSL